MKFMCITVQLGQQVASIVIFILDNILWTPTRFASVPAKCRNFFAIENIMVSGIIAFEPVLVPTKWTYVF